MAEATAVAARVGLGIAAVIGALFLLVPRLLLALFGMTDPEVVAIGVQLLRYLAVSGFFITVVLAYTGGLQGTGDTRSPLVISLVSQVVVPNGTCWWIQSSVGLWPAAIWGAIVAGHVTRCALSVFRFRSRHWRRIRVDVGSPAAS